ncbi:cation transporter dimerization domain-containing protein [Vreelandella boliviensis]|uniref:cation transporter dimerization domain-containing protein n=1 Tax=Vreelandella boliviensis TaxID=223527 RepID=UPI0005904762|nr:cation transporter [Halomonas boliviensis]
MIDYLGQYQKRYDISVERPVKVKSVIENSDGLTVETDKSTGVVNQFVTPQFDGVPDGIDMKTINQTLLALPGVVGVHDLHVWAMSTSYNALTVHLVIDNNLHNYDAYLNKPPRYCMTVLRYAIAFCNKNPRCTPQAGP